MTKPNANRNGILAIAVGTALAVVSVALPAWTGLWKWLGVTDDMRATLSGVLAIVFVNAGFLVGIYFQQNDFKQEVLSTQRQELAEFRSAIPSLQVFATYSGESAIRALGSTIRTARLALNTRILAPKIGEVSHGSGSQWDNAVRDSIRAGLVFREVVSPDNEPLVRRRAAESLGGAGAYQAFILRHSLPSFMNFIVLESLDGQKEVWFGWTVSKTSGWEGAVVRTGEARIVGLFERWHGELQQAGQRLR